MTKKRFIFLLVASLAFASTASAQVRLDTALQAFVTSFEGVKGVEFDPQAKIAADKITVGEIPQGNLYDGVDTMLTGTPLTWEIRDRVVVIKMRETRAIAPAATTSQTDTPVATGCPQVRYYDPTGTVTPDSPDPIKRMLWWRNVGYPCQRWQRFDEERTIAQLNSLAYRAPAVYPVYAGAAPVYGRGFGYAPNSGYLPYWMMMPGCATGPAGYLKFKYNGPEKERELWEVTFNNWIKGSIDQGDSYHNRIELCAGDYIVVAKKRDVGQSEPRNYTVSPYTLTEVTVGDFLLPKEEDK